MSTQSSYRAPGTILAGLFFLLVILYALYEGSALIVGPVIQLDTPETIVAVQEPLVRIAGTAERITALYINGREVSVTEAGYFEDELLLAPGYNKVSIVATDRAARETVKDIEIVYTPMAPSPSVRDQSLPVTELNI